MKILDDKYDKKIPCQYVTTYRKDFIKRKLQKLPKFKLKQEFQDPMGHAFETYLEIGKDDIKPPFEDGDIYVEKGDMLKKIAKMEEIAQRLPDGWTYPLTTQKYDFRNPASLTQFEIERPSIVKPLDNIVPDEKLNEIMKLQKIDSEYNTVIGKLGGFIVENEMHGKIDKVE